MNIVMLDSKTMNPGDLSWEPLGKLGALTTYDRTAPEDTVARAADAEVVLTNKTVLDREIIRQLPKLQYIGVAATGYNVVDLDAARERGIPVTNVPAYSTLSVVQMVFAHLLNLAWRLSDHVQGVREGRWAESPDFCYWDTSLVELDGLTLGIVGLGGIGREVARVARAFGMKVIAKTRTTPAELPEGVVLVDLDTLFRESDVVSLHCPLTDETEGLVNRERLALMKPTAFLINTGRGPLVDEPALADALSEGHIAGAAADVLSTEPPSPDNPLLSAPNCYITPHHAWATRAARQRLLRTVADNVAAFLAGAPQNVVNA